MPFARYYIYICFWWKNTPFAIERYSGQIFDEYICHWTTHTSLLICICSNVRDRGDRRNRATIRKILFFSTYLLYYDAILLQTIKSKLEVKLCVCEEDNWKMKPVWQGRNLVFGCCTNIVYLFQLHESN